MSIDVETINARVQQWLTDVLVQVHAGGELELQSALASMRRAWTRAIAARTDRIKAVTEAQVLEVTTLVPFALELPIHTFSEANLHVHHMERHKLSGDQRPVVAMAMRSHARRRGFRAQLPCMIRLTRLAPDLLDVGDNLEMSMKHVRDGVADWLGVNDRTPSVRWEIRQERQRKPGVRIEVVL
jgi:hypothetical protein